VSHVERMKTDYTGILSGAYFVRHRYTGEVRIVQLGAMYNQSQWELLHEVTHET
jgi:citrate lyase synthetase